MLRRLSTSCIPLNLLNRYYASKESVSVENSPRTEPRLHRKLYHLTLREEKEEKLRDFLPANPLLPSGWSLRHEPGSNRFDLKKEVEIRNCGAEVLHIIALMEVKQYEHTFRMDNGEREEQEYLNFTLFLKKKRYPKGGLEFGLTSIDMELVLDSLAIHDSDESIENAITAFDLDPTTRSSPGGTNLFKRRKRDSRYRGPMISELDDDLSDEILDYLDERGVNNPFAEYMMSQAHYFEQEEYLNWLHLLRRFAD
ncbi:unnamed protein product [Phytomonas sp. EM1]|nr:unnamed protein product [Phytomonas sp. EM1]|eukprot:CCW61991.1 unnamed protein product [Phytomonas sp. isolate EM1]